MVNPPKRNNRESGNILVYIMGAILLLGLLVMISKGSNTPGAGIDQETLSIRVSEVQSFGQELERAVAYVLANGHSEVDIRFAHPDAASAYGDITDDPTRQVFSRQGGAATYRQPPDGIQTTATPWVFSGFNRVLGIGVDTVAGNTELTAILPYVTKDFCLLINEKNSIDNPAGSPPQDDASINITTLFDGTFAPAGGNLIGGPGLENNFKSEGCLEAAGTPPIGTYHYYRVLLPR